MAKDRIEKPPKPEDILQKIDDKEFQILRARVIEKQNLSN